MSPPRALPLLLLLASSCALLTKSEPLEVRWFTPERTTPRVTSASPARVELGPELRLGHILSATHLRERMVYRDAAFEVGFYEERRWTERPDAFLRRELARTLFEERGFQRALGGLAPVLDIELVAFEEVLTPRDSAARVQIRMLLSDGRESLHEETITVDEPLARDAPAPVVVAAMAQALDRVTTTVADRVAVALAARRKPPPPVPPPPAWP